MAATASSLSRPAQPGEAPKLLLGGYVALAITATLETITLGLVLLFKLRSRRNDEQ